MPLKTLIKFLPWILVVLVLVFFSIHLMTSSSSKPTEIVTSDIVLTSISSLGNMELTKYQFKEIIENKQLSKEYFNLFKLGIDSKIVLICTGEAVGCVDFTKIGQEDIVQDDSIIYITMPKPELCYHKLDLEKTRIYSLETSRFIDQNEFIQKAYKTAEAEIKSAALASNILEQTERSAVLILEPILSQLTDRKIKIDFVKEQPALNNEVDFMSE